MQNETFSVRRGQEEAAWVLHQKQEELQSTCQGQEESVDGAGKPDGVRTVGAHAKERSQPTPFKKKGNEIQSAFIDQVVEQVVLARHIERVEVTP